MLEVNITGNCGQYIKNCLQLPTEDVRQYYRPLVPYCKRRVEGMGVGIDFAGNVNVIMVNILYLYRNVQFSKASLNGVLFL